ncbi:MAG: dolichyl-phosphate-mannose--protein mannosyltransferase [Betaproteobacteria bacterium]|nr:dolichyl-phosphate-mannose--protein mannosyltransferase [Betaproteobacteria bacterium]
MNSSSSSLSPDPNAARRWWWLYAIAAASFLPALGFYYVGEEAIFPKSALEMWWHGEPIRRLLFGVDLQHNPLFTWLIIPLSALAGWDSMLVVTRAITIAATVLSGLVLAGLAQALYGSRLFSAIAAVIYLTLLDLFLYRGWLAYVDPLFGLLVFAAITALWLACERRSAVWLGLAVLALSGAFLAKALTAYAFYGGAALVLLLRGHWRFLLSPASWVLHGAALVFPLLWFRMVMASSGQGTRMFSEIVAKLMPQSFTEYGLKLLAYPLETLFCLAPAGVIALWLLLRRRVDMGGDRHLLTAALSLLAGLLPYWLAPQSHVRYLVPLYPLAGLVIARILWLAGEGALGMTRKWLIGLIVIKLAVVLVAFPLYQQRYRGANYAEAAQAIIARTAGQPLYTLNVSASGLSVTAYIDVARLPLQPLAFPPAGWQDGFVLAYDPDDQIGPVVEQYRLGGNTLYLLCRGSACAPQPPAAPLPEVQPAEVQPAEGLRR